MDPADLQSQVDDLNTQADAAEAEAADLVRRAREHEAAAIIEYPEPLERIHFEHEAHKMHGQADDATSRAADLRRQAADLQRQAADRTIELEQQANETDRQASELAVGGDDFEADKFSREADDLRRRAKGV